MGLQSSFYTLNGRTTKFTSTKYMPNKDFVRVFVQKGADNTWDLLSANDYNIVNNSVVTSYIIDSLIYKKIEIRVADSENELTDSQSDISVVSGIASDIVTVAGISTDVTTVVGLSADVVKVSAIDTDVTTVAGVSTDIPTVANSDTEIVAVGTDVLKGKGTNLPTDSAILNALDNATNAATSETNAATSATNAATSETNAATSETNAATSATNAATSETNAATSEANAAQSATDAAQSEANINPTNLLHTVGNGGGNPEGYTTAEAVSKAELVTTTPIVGSNVEQLNGSSAYLSTDNLLHIQDQKPSGTAGGATPVSNNVVRDLNTVVINNISGASLASNQVTLPVGKYYFDVVTEIVAGVNCIIKIRNTTDNIKELQGVNTYSNVTYTGGATPKVSGVIGVVGSSKVYEVLMYIENLNANNLGIASPDGTIEVYTDLKIWKVG